MQIALRHIADSDRFDWLAASAEVIGEVVYHPVGNTQQQVKAAQAAVQLDQQNIAVTPAERMGEQHRDGGFPGASLSRGY